MTLHNIPEGMAAGVFCYFRTKEVKKLFQSMAARFPFRIMRKLFLPP